MKYYKTLERRFKNKLKIDIFYSFGSNNLIKSKSFSTPLFFIMKYLVVIIDLINFTSN